MAKDKSVIPIERIAAQIYVIRGESVMLDADLAELYHVETGALVRAMKDQRGHLNRMLRLALPFFVDATCCAQTLAQMRRHPELAAWVGD